MGAENAAKMIFLPSPFTPDDPARFDDEVLIAAEKDHRDQFAFLGGGGSLNVMLQQAVHAQQAGPEVQKKFKERAEQIVRQGASGFGEMTTEHFATTPGSYYEYAPTDHPKRAAIAGRHLGRTRWPAHRFTHGGRSQADGSAAGPEVPAESAGSSREYRRVRAAALAQSSRQNRLGT